MRTRITSIALSLSIVLPSALVNVLSGCTSAAEAVNSQHLAAASFADKCTALADVKIAGGHITTAQFIAAGKDGSDPVPEHCKLQGKLQEYTGVDGKPYALGFELRLPQQWNSRFYFQGGGGTDGVVRPAVGTLPGGGQTTNALSQGFAVVDTDSGHLNEPGPIGPYLFAVDPQARINLGYNHLPVVTATAKDLIQRIYGRKPEHSYFVGCSNGGRQGLMAAERFPQLFDGIIAQAPAYRVPQAAVDAIAQIQAIASVAPMGADGRPVLGSAFSPAELSLIAHGILDACDALDGAKDGMVQSISCKFDPAILQCSAGKNEGCLDAKKVAVIDKMFKGARDASGQVIYSEWAYDPGIDSPLWTMWKWGPPTIPPQAINTSLIAGGLSYVFTTPPVLSTNLYDFALGFDLNRDAPKITQTNGIFKESAVQFMNADSANITAFQDRGGKLLLFHGGADPIFSARDTVSYLNKLQARYGRTTADFARLFLIPGMAHCAGGPATDKFDGLTVLMDWVEHGMAPTSIAAQATAMTPWPNRTRPLCAYPTQATYSGSGSIEDAANFSCR
jgi:feruloyl esterase